MVGLRRPRRQEKVSPTANSTTRAPNWPGRRSVLIAASATVTVATTLSSPRRWPGRQPTHRLRGTTGQGNRWHSRRRLCGEALVERVEVSGGRRHADKREGPTE